MLADETILNEEINLKTAPLLNGTFEVNPLEGIGMETNFTLGIYDWNQGDNVNLPLTYVFYQIIDDKIVSLSRFYDKVEGTIEGNYLTEDNQGKLIQRLKMEKVMMFPLVSESKLLKLTLRVYNNLTLEEVSRNVTLKPSNKTSLDDILSNFTGNVDYSLDYVSLLVKSFSHGMSSQLQQTNSREEEMKKSVNTQYVYTCDPAVDCSSKGECLSQIKNVKIKCRCDPNWFGRSCSWTEKVCYNVYFKH